MYKPEASIHINGVILIGNKLNLLDPACADWGRYLNNLHSTNYKHGSLFARTKLLKQKLGLDLTATQN